MNISYSWLKKYLDFDMTAHEIGEVLTSIGLEVGGVDEHETIRGGLRGLVIGKVLTCREHTNSDHLHVTTVDLGVEYTPDGPIQIVCGAPNISAGQTVVVATVGTTLYSGDESFTIKKGKIRGEESLGMICSADEIGVGSDHSGIMVLPDDIPAGTPAAEYFNVQSDYVIEVDITPNRVDATSHYGVARDLYAYLAAREIPCTLRRPEASEVRGTGEPVQLTVDAPEAVIRYSGVVITGLKVQESPEWLKNALQIIGQKSINNVVDVSNYILQAVGQPLHTFDLRQIKGDEVVVRMARAGETLETLDHTTHELTEHDLVICDHDRPLCLAGVMGGVSSGVTEDTTDIFLEVATFHPTYVRKSARRHGLSTDSSFRFERGLDPNDVPYALQRAVALITEIAGGQVASKVYDYYPKPVGRYEVTLTYHKLNTLIGIEIPREQVRRILVALDIQVQAESADELRLLVPRYRYDVTRDVDVIEDILRIYGYNNIPMPTFFTSSITTKSVTDQSIRLQQKVSEQLVGAGFFEILNNSLSMERYYTRDEEQKASVRLLNPLSNDLSTLRMTLVHGGLEVIEHNIKRQVRNLRLFEYGNVYRRVCEGEDTALKGFRENYRLGVWITGDKLTDNWDRATRQVSIFEMKATVYNLLTRLGVRVTELCHETVEDDPYFTKAEVLTLRGGGEICRWGMLSEGTISKHDIEIPVYYAELEWAEIMNRILGRTPKITQIPKYPSVRRDFALLIDKSMPFSEIERVAYSAERKLLRSITLFDVYEDPKHLPAGKKSYAVAFELRNDEKTLDDQSIEKTMNRIFDALKRELSAELR